MFFFSYFHHRCTSVLVDVFDRCFGMWRVVVTVAVCVVGGAVGLGNSRFFFCKRLTGVACLGGAVGSALGGLIGVGKSGFFFCILLYTFLVVGGSCSGCGWCG